VAVKLNGNALLLRRRIFDFKYPYLPLIVLTPLFFGCAGGKVTGDFFVFHCRRLAYMSAYGRFRGSVSIRSACCFEA